ncbi:hypothetical protein LQW54_012413 [Pestalotiopsis sp. IQ-011]
MPKLRRNCNPSRHGEIAESTGNLDEEDLYDENKQLNSALRGHHLPSDELLLEPRARHYVISGIRRYIRFAELKSMIKMCNDNAVDFQSSRVRGTRELTETKSVEARPAVKDKKPTSTLLHGLASAQLMDTGEGQDLAGKTGFYGDAYLTTFGSGKIDVFICATDEARAQAAEEEGGWMESLEVVEDEY